MILSTLSSQEFKLLPSCGGVIQTPVMAFAEHWQLPQNAQVGKGCLISLLANFLQERGMCLKYEQHQESDTSRTPAAGIWGAKVEFKPIC